MGHRINKAAKAVILYDNGRMDSLSVIMRKVVAAGGPDGWKIVPYCPEEEHQEAYDRTSIGFRLPEPSEGVNVVSAPVELTEVDLDDVDGPWGEKKEGRSGRRRSGERP